MLSRRVAGLVFSAALSLSTGCTPGNEGVEDGGANAGGSGSGASNPSNNGGSTSNNEGGGFISDGGSSNTGGGCAGEDYSAEKVPLDIYIMLDQSGSMGQGSGKWEAVTSALTTFFNQPESAAIGVGIQYFPQEGSQQCNTFMCTTTADCGAGCGTCQLAGPFGVCTGFGSTDSCLPLDYSTPDVPIAPVATNATALINSMAQHGPTGGTPTSAALQGAIDYARAWGNAHVGHAVVVILATDGDPEGCDDDLNHINAIAASGVSGMPKVLTFVIGVGGSEDALDGFAAAGGTTEAFMVDQDPNVQQAFLDALNVIQGQAIPCAFLVPQPDSGEDINFGQVNVSYTPSAGDEQTVPYVQSAANCPASGLGWYYDDALNPTQILLCSDTCSTISADTGGSVKIVVGCDTIAG